MILEVLGSSAIGSLLGGVFGWLSKREERASMALKMEHDLSMIQAKTTANIQIAKMGIEEAKVAGTLMVDKLEATAFVESQKSTSKVADIIKSVIRPIILGLLMYQSYLIINSLESITSGLTSLPEQDIIDLYKIVILSVTGLTATAVGWYFAARSSKQFDKLLAVWSK